MKKTLSILIAALLVLVVSLGCVFSVRLYNIGENYLTRLEISYRGALGEISDNLEKTSLTLRKIKYSSGNHLRHKASDTVISCCAAAKSSAASLPFSEENSEKIEKLLSVTEDYSRYIGSKIARGENLTSEELDNFEALASLIDKLKDETNSIRVNIGENNRNIAEVLSVFSGELSIPDGEKFDSAYEGFLQDSESFQGLVYDGPFSSHIERRIALYLENKEEITKEEALKIAADFLDRDVNSLKCEYETEGTLASYEITGENVKALVTKKGGEISFAKITGDFLESNLSYEDALKEATEFLKESGIENLKETSFVISDNTCTINFCSFKNGILFYPDLIKITVELNEGKMVEYEATGFLMNHRERGTLSPLLSEAEAEKFISDKLNIKEIKLALIPSDGLNEILCYEFTMEYTEPDGEKTEILSYINAENGSEEQLYIIDRNKEHLYLN